MDIKVSLKIEGLEPLACAINNLATAYSNSGAAAAAVIDKASKASKTKPAAEVKAEDPKSASVEQTSTTSAPVTTTENLATSAPTVSPTEGKPADTPAASATEASAESQAPAATGTATASPSKSISDEDLRAAAGEAAKRDKQKVKDLVAKYAPNVSAIPAEVRADFLKELAAV